MTGFNAFSLIVMAHDSRGRQEDELRCRSLCGVSVDELIMKCAVQYEAGMSCDAGDVAYWGAMVVEDRNVLSCFSPSLLSGLL